MNAARGLRMPSGRSWRTTTLWWRCSMLRLLPEARLKTTAAGVTDRVWTVEDIVTRIARTPQPEPRVPYKKHAADSN